ncbi:MAG TPA: metalloregulator ArsR/SmtB family transcription factor [Thermoanaerobaculia bacterium]|nr:metalloregulator ArsR/SmtB family transcription factor [Thermoanaerobaculia bacterium]HUM29419.1 metalloregulator ArsR/SmtB family transcription factor [Thermoanaerobaculia bacterium]HXK67665.1 metalloregulator ArsR/SmtB family transcription factor [Thermoanaerobaculia bacterium]
MQEEANLFKTLGDPTRLRLAVLLALQGETCVCFLAQALGEPDFKVSRHLSVMRASGIVEARREGTWMHYRLVQPTNQLASGLQDCLKQCFTRHPVIEKDLQRMRMTTCARG